MPERPDDIRASPHSCALGVVGTGTAAVIVVVDSLSSAAAAPHLVSAVASAGRLALGDTHAHPSQSLAAAAAHDDLRLGTAGDGGCLLYQRTGAAIGKGSDAFNHCG